MHSNPIIPIFPLPLVAFPNETVPLHVFEERYKEMVAFCRAAKANNQFHGFGIVQEQSDRVFDTGCVMEIKAIIREYKDGRLDIITRGGARFKVEEIFNERAYYTARVRIFEDRSEPVDASIKAAVAHSYQRLIDLMRQDARLAGQIPAELDAQAEAFALGAELGLEMRMKQYLLEMESETERLAALRDHLDQLVPALEAQLEKSKEKRKRTEGNGHFNGHLN